MNDLARAKRIAAGDDTEWHAFVLEHERLIESVARRTFRDTDGARDVLALTLTHIRDSAIATYEGRSKLSTWVAVVTTRIAVDEHRRRYGRRRPPRAWGRLTDAEKAVFNLFHESGLSVAATADAARISHDLSHQDVVHALDRIDEVVDRRTLDRLAFDHHARDVGVRCGQLLRYAESERADRQVVARSEQPDAELRRTELVADLERLRSLVSELDESAQEALDLKYRRGFTASEISAHTGLPRRRVYSLLDGAVRRLRDLFDRSSPNEESP